MRERRSVDRGVEARRMNEPYCEVLSSATLARYLVRTLPKADSGAVEGHLQGCDECWAVLENAYKLLSAH
jgi:hypothetical protein